eukprot:Hpha_TRINITY_DN15551_c4_g6::TRINITY_DN15551_c4_g6_i1::g.106623::m.106623
MKAVMSGTIGFFGGLLVVSCFGGSHRPEPHHPLPSVYSPETQHPPSCAAIEVNPEDVRRRSSSVFGNDPPGTGHNSPRLGSLQSWSSATIDPQGAWHEMDLGVPVRVVGVVIQPRARSSKSRSPPQLVRRFRVMVAESGRKRRDRRIVGTFEAAKDVGRHDARTVVTFPGGSPIRARWVRVEPLACLGHCSMRVGVLVCAGDVPEGGVHKLEKPPSGLDDAAWGLPLSSALTCVADVVEAQRDSCSCTVAADVRAGVLACMPTARSPSHARSPTCEPPLPPNTPTPDATAHSSFFGGSSGVSDKVKADDVVTGMLLVDDYVRKSPSFNGGTWLGRRVTEHPNDFFALQQIVWHEAVSTYVEVGEEEEGGRLAHGVWHVMQERDPKGHSVTLLPAQGAPDPGVCPKCSFPEGHAELRGSEEDVAKMLRGVRRNKVFVSVSGKDEDEIYRRLATFAKVIPAGSWLLCRRTGLSRIGGNPAPANAVRRFLSQHQNWVASEAAEAPQLMSRHQAGWLRRLPEGISPPSPPRVPLDPAIDLRTLGDSTSGLREDTLERLGWKGKKVSPAVLLMVDEELGRLDQECSVSVAQADAPGKPTCEAGRVRKAIAGLMSGGGQGEVCKWPDKPPLDSPVPSAGEVVQLRGRKVCLDSIVFGFDQLHDTLKIFSRTSWLGAPMQQNAADWWAMQEILWKQRVDLVVEIGTNTGGGAIGFWHVMKTYAPSGHVLTIDPRHLVSWDRRECPGCLPLDKHPLWEHRAGNCDCCGDKECEVERKEGCKCEIRKGRGGIVRIR